MRNYQIFLIEEEFAHHYYGREKLFFNLFLEYIHSSGKLRDILQKQIEYITKSIPVVRLEDAFAQRVKMNQSLLSHNGKYFLKYKNNSQASLIMDKYHLSLTAEGDYEAETAFFECLRKCESSFLALDYENIKYGWLKPIKERKFV